MHFKGRRADCKAAGMQYSTTAVTISCFTIRPCPAPTKKLNCDLINSPCIAARAPFNIFSTRCVLYILAATDAGDIEQGAQAGQHAQDAEHRPKSEQRSDQGRESERQTQNVVAVTVDFFRQGSYTPALPSTAPFTPLAAATKQANTGGGIDTSKSLGGKLENSKEDEGTGDVARKLASLTHDLKPNRSADVSDVEKEVCVLWLQVRARK